MTGRTEQILVYFYMNRDSSISIADLVGDLQMSRQDVVESLKFFQKADLITMATCEYGRITEKGLEEGRRLSSRNGPSESPVERRGGE